MRLIIFPGVGNPEQPKYKSVYRLLESAAQDRGYKSVDTTLRWPGQNLNGKLTLEGAVAVAQEMIHSLEVNGQRYDFLARSFGCYVALKIALDKQPNHLRRIILWGPPPYWLMWEMWCRDIESNRQLVTKNNFNLDESFFSTLVPLECILPEMRYEIVLAVGDQDPYVSPVYFGYIEAICRDRISSEHCQSLSFRPAVQGAVHEVTEDAPAPVIEAYLKALFE